MNGLVTDIMIMGKGVLVDEDPPPHRVRCFRQPGTRAQGLDPPIEGNYDRRKFWCFAQGSSGE